MKLHKQAYIGTAVVQSPVEKSRIGMHERKTSPDNTRLRKRGEDAE